MKMIELMDREGCTMMKYRAGNVQEENWTSLHCVEMTLDSMRPVHVS